MKEIYSRKEAAKVAGVSPRTILRAIHARQLDAVKIGEGKTCSYMISREAVAEYVHRRGCR
ncbi:helix-turn-helix domain-containing protein [Paenibacillus validus]|uniref:helix-turn-helix domain-containing protein n=1 Tax=Paenibacillus validus TaxID=44253 RepID=UPI000FD98DE3|nr:helix-turn-helix domain-containing protein [Paenibacillus validus]MED4599675.1 helix-turn-helix domain-containing protein [Paenibacillus validus]MED4604892.1 helix-turn-helix domain-containing protein [Paenibacillus validus]